MHYDGNMMVTMLDGKDIHTLCLDSWIDRCMFYIFIDTGVLLFIVIDYIPIFPLMIAD